MSKTQEFVRADDTWNAVVDQLSVNPRYDRDGAVAVADDVRDALENRRDYNLTIERRKTMQWLLRTGGQILGWTAAALVVSAGLFFGIRAIIDTQSDDYADFSTPAHVQSAGYYVIRDWYGMNEMPPQLVEISQRKIHVDNGEAYLVKYRDADKKTYCVTVWGGSTETPTTVGGEIVECTS